MRPQACSLTASSSRAPRHRTQSCRVGKYHEAPAQLATNPTRRKKVTKTYRQPILLINSLIILPSKHITEMPNRRIMHDGDLIPPLLRLLPITPRMILLACRGRYHITNQLRIPASLPRNRDESLSVLIIALLPIWMVEM